MRRSIGSLVSLVALALSLFILAPASASALEFETEDGGAGLFFEAHARNYTLFAFSPESDLAPASETGLVVERVRPIIDGWLLQDRLRYEAAYDLIPVIGAVGDSSAGFAVQTRASQRIVDFDPVLFTASSDTLQLSHNLDRLNVALILPVMDLRIGRQAMSHGSSRMFPASDLFGPFGPGSIDTEFKRGVDAVRATIPIGSEHEAEVYVVADDLDLENWLYLGRWRSTINQTLDLSILAGSTYKQPTLGLDLTGGLRGAGWYVEALGRYNLEEDELRARATAGIDYQWLFGLRTLLELHYNGDGAAHPYSDALLDPTIARQVGEVFLLGRFYAGTTVSYTLGPLSNVGATAMVNLEDGSTLLSMNLGKDFAENVAVGLGALVPIGKGPGLDDAGMPELGSEFGAFPFLFFTDLRLVF